MDKTPEEILEENGYEIEILQEEETMFFRNPDYSSAIIGISDDYHIIYSYDKMVEYLVSHDEMTIEEAVDFIDYNTLRAYTSKGKMPIVVYTF